MKNPRVVQDKRYPLDNNMTNFTKYTYFDLMIPTKIDGINSDMLNPELMWENKIEYKIDNAIRFESLEKTSFFKIIKKYLSKRIRNLYR